MKRFRDVLVLRDGVASSSDNPFPPSMNLYLFAYAGQPALYPACIFSLLAKLGHTPRY